MDIKQEQENEITIRITCSEQELIKHLETLKFIKGRKFTLDDYYLIPKSLNFKKMTAREILAKSVIIRNTNNDGKREQKITIKNKNINERGEILNQKKTNCKIIDYKEGIKLFEELGYYQIMNIKERDVIYFKENIELAIKILEKDNILIEIETNDKYTTIEELKKIVNDLNIAFEKGNYFVKKAEEKLNKILKYS